MDAGRREDWPPLARGASGSMGTLHRPNVPPNLSLLANPMSSRAPSTSSPAFPSPKSSSSSSRVAVGSPLNPSLYSVSPPPTQPTSAPLIRHRTALPASLQGATGISLESANPAIRPSAPLVPSGRWSGNGSADTLSVASASPALGHPGSGCHKTLLSQHYHHRQHQRHSRGLSESSTETVRGPPPSVTFRSDLSNDSSRANSISSNPMPPFSRYDAYDNRSITGSPDNSVSRTPSAVCADLHTKYQLEEMMTATGRPRAPLVLVLQDTHGHASREGFPYLKRRLSSSSMHGFVLGIQCFTLLVVSSALVWVTVWKRTKASVDFWSWLWTIAEPSVGILLLLCFLTLMAHEVRSLSNVAHLYLQAAILVVATLVAGALVIRCLEQESRTVKGVITGCCAWMWASALLGFLRAAVIWKMESMDSCDYEAGAEGEAEAMRRRVDGEAVAYGTFVLVDQRSG